MKKSIAAALMITALVTGTLRADPQLTSWLTTYSGQYARLYASDATKASGTAVTTWSRGSISQSSPTYCGVHEVSSSATWVYLRTTGLGSHVMGPWYLNAGHTMDFPNFPKNTATLFRIPRTSTVSASKTSTTGGAIGIFVDGVAMFDSRDTFSYSNANGKDADPTAGIGTGDGMWNRDAIVNEGVTLDPALAHQPGSGQYHYHANPPALRYLLGDNVNFNSTAKTYAEITNSPTLQHSPIIGWVRDGYPIYGPYGYSVSNDASSGIRRMISGFVARNITVRTNLPAWAQRVQNRPTLTSNQYGPTVNATYMIGRYLEDYDYLGDLGFVQGTNTFDLDEYNGRWCVTPEFPGGTYAYFTAISSNGTPVYPYNIGRQYYGNPTGGTVGSITEAVTTSFTGGSYAELRLAAPVVSNNVVTLTWSATEGGTYRVEATGNLTSWTTNATGITAVLSKGTASLSATTSNQWFHVTRTSLATYDSTGF